MKNQVLIISTVGKSATYTKGKFDFFGGEVEPQVKEIINDSITVKVLTVNLNQFENLTSNQCLFFRENYLIGIQEIENEISIVGYLNNSNDNTNVVIYYSYLNNCNFMEEIWESFWECEWLRNYWLSYNKENNGSSWWDITSTPINSLRVLVSLYNYPSEELVKHLNKDRLEGGEWVKKYS